MVCIVEIEVYSREECLVIDLVLDGQTFFLIATCPEETDQRQPLTIFVRVDCSFVRENRRRRDRTRRIADRFTQICAVQVFPNPLKRKEVERLVFLEWSTNRCAVLLAIKSLERSAVRSICR